MNASTSLFGRIALTPFGASHTILEKHTGGKYFFSVPTTMTDF